ncbi:MAG: DNA polymerase IV [Bacteroidales bacterium]
MIQENPRKIIHIDMDAFYASIEQRDNPSLKGKPVAVGGASKRGVVAAASYESRKFGVKSAMSSVVAKRLCPGLIFIRPRFEVYKSVSETIMEIFHEYTDLVEPLSLDEAFLDVTSNKTGISSATSISMEIKKKIKQQTGLTASAGISVNKFLAKIASDMDKPDGIYLIRPERVEGFVEKLPVEKFFGVGPVTASKMHNMGIFRGADLKKMSREDLQRFFGKPGDFYYEISRGIDNRPVNPVRIRKSVGTEETYEKDLRTRFEIVAALYEIEKELDRRLKKKGFEGKTLTLKVKYNDFKQVTRAKTLSGKIDSFKKLHELSKNLLYSFKYNEKPIRLLGLSVSNAEDNEKEEPVQLTLDF